MKQKAAPPSRAKTPPKPTKRRLLWLDITVGVSAAVLLGFGLWSSARDDAQGICAAVGAEHQVVLANDAFAPTAVVMQRCDTLKVLNQGPEDYELVFGTRDVHASYPGFNRQTLRPNEFFVLDAVQAGTYTMHDHLRDNARLSLDIRK